MYTVVRLSIIMIKIKNNEKQIHSDIDINIIQNMILNNGKRLMDRYVYVQIPLINQITLLSIKMYVEIFPIHNMTILVDLGDKMPMLLCRFLNDMIIVNSVYLMRVYIHLLN